MGIYCGTDVFQYHVNYFDYEFSHYLTSLFPKDSLGTREVKEVDFWFQWSSH